MIELADTFHHDYEENGVYAGTAFVTALRGGKTSRDGQVQFGGFLRHLDVLACTIAVHAVFLFAR
jgi:hypothetical protein